ncbi:MAG: PAS domain S-box protein, partial [Proteobacteria bacterium]
MRKLLKTLFSSFHTAPLSESVSGALQALRMASDPSSSDVRFFERSPANLAVVDSSGRMLQTNLAFRSAFQLSALASQAISLQELVGDLRNRRAIDDALSTSDKLGTSSADSDRFRWTFTTVGSETHVQATELNSLLSNQEVSSRVESLFSAVLDELPVSISLKDAETMKYVLFNKIAAERTGVPKEKVLGKTAYDIFPFHYADKIHKTDRQAVSSPGEILEHYDVVELAGHSMHIASKKLLIDSGFTKKMVLGVGDDVSEFKLIESQLLDAKKQAEKSDAEKSKFVAHMSHEIRTPLNGIIATSNLLKDLVDNDEQRRYVKILEDSGNLLLRIIDDILDFSKIEAGKIILEPIPFNLTEALEIQTDLFTALARSKNLALMSFVDPRIPNLLVGDSARLGQIVVNLISNAIKFTSNGSVFVRAKLESLNRSAAIVRFSVTDTGCGIGDAQLALLFQPFIQGSNVSKRQHGGTGLGLSISQNLAELMNSTIKVESSTDESDHGTTFSFSLHLPIAKSKSDQVTSVEPIIPTQGKVLIVDDSSEACAIMKTYLKGSAFSCDAVTSGLKA